MINNRYSVLILGLLASSIAFAIPSEDLKGVHGWIKPEFESYSPVAGYTLLKSQVLRNYRFFGNYGPLNPAHPFGDTLPPENVRGHTNDDGVEQPGFIKREDCPQDFMSEWIQRLFPSPTGHTLTMNTSAADPISKLTPEVIGRILSRIARASDEDFAQGRVEKDLSEVLMTQLSHEDQTQYQQLLEREKNEAELKNRRDRRAKLAAKGDRCSEEEKIEMAALKEQINEIAEILKPRSKSPKNDSPRSQNSQSSDSGNDEGAGAAAVNTQTQTTQVRAKKPRELKKEVERLTHLAHLITEALKESRRPHSRYPRHLAEQALLAYFMEKEPHKEALLKLFQGMPELLKDHKITTDSEVQAHFIADRWHPADIESFGANAKAQASRFAQDPEALIYFTHHKAGQSRPIPPIVSYKPNVAHSSLSGSKHGDCGETMVRDLFNVAFFNPKMRALDPERLNELKAAHPELKFAESLRQFYTDSKDPNKDPKDPKVHDEWNEKVISGLHPVSYSKPSHAPVCDMNAGVDNLIAAIGSLIFDGVIPNPLVGSRAEKLNAIFKYLSPKGTDWTWSVKGANPSEKERKLNDPRANTAIQLIVNLGTAPLMELQFTPGHFEVVNLTQLAEPWKKELLNELRPHVKSQEHLEKHLSSFIPWLVDGQNIDSLPQEWKTPETFHALPLVTATDQLEAFKTLATQPHAREMTVLAQIIKERNTEQGARSIIGIAESDHNYPFGDPPHLIGHPEIPYHRVSHPQLGESAWQIGDLTWGDTVRGGEPPQDREMNWQTAFAYCLSLNPQSERAKILQKLRTKNSLGKLAPELPERGCFLPRRQEYANLGHWMGYRFEGSQYVPQLPHLYGRWFWSSSVNPNDPEIAFNFHGDRGDVNDDYRAIFRSVRCVCVGAAW